MLEFVVSLTILYKDMKVESFKYCFLKKLFLVTPDVSHVYVRLVRQASSLL